MDTMVKQKFQQAISRVWVQRAHKKLTDQQFLYLVHGANYALQNLDVHYSIKQKKLVDGGEVNVPEEEPVEISYFQKGYLLMAGIAEKEGIDIPEMPVSLSL